MTYFEASCNVMITPVHDEKLFLSKMEYYRLPIIEAKEFNIFYSNFHFIQRLYFSII